MGAGEFGGGELESLGGKLESLGGGKLEGSRGGGGVHAVPIDETLCQRFTQDFPVKNAV